MKVFSKQEYQLRVCVSRSASWGAYANGCNGGSYALRVSHWKIGAHSKGLKRKVGMKVPFLCREC